MPFQPWSQPLARTLGRLRDGRPLPPAVTSTGVGLALVVSTVPSLLPRTALVQGLLSGGLVLAALAVVVVGRGAVQRVRRRGPSSPAART